MGGHEISISVRDVKSVEMFSLAVKLRVIGIDHYLEWIDPSLPSRLSPHKNALDSWQ